MHTNDNSVPSTGPNIQVSTNLGLSGIDTHLIGPGPADGCFPGTTYPTTGTGLYPSSVPFPQNQEPRVTPTHVPVGCTGGHVAGEDDDTDTLINLVLDTSGSMGVVRAATIEGFNTFLTEQRALPGAARASVTLFNTNLDARHVACPLATIPDLGTTGNPYVPSGGTALFDAVGVSISGTEAWIRNHNYKGRAICVVITDGAENASRQWHLQPDANEQDLADVGVLITRKQRDDDWEFVFLGSGGSDWLEATFGRYVAAERIHQVAHTSAGAAVTYSSLSAAMSNTRLAGTSFNLSGLDAEPAGT